MDEADNVQWIAGTNGRAVQDCAGRLRTVDDEGNVRLSWTDRATNQRCIGTSISGNSTPLALWNPEGMAGCCMSHTLTNLHVPKLVNRHEGLARERIDGKLRRSEAKAEAQDHACCFERNEKAVRTKRRQSKSWKGLDCPTDSGQDPCFRFCLPSFAFPFMQSAYLPSHVWWKFCW